MTPKDTTLASRLFQHPYDFEFEQAVTILEALQRRCAPLGAGSDSRYEAVALKGPLLPRLMPSTISAFSIHSATEQPTMTVELLGLGGPDGPLPYAYQDWLASLQVDKDLATEAFLNLFQHRLLSILYRIQTSSRLFPRFSLRAPFPSEDIFLGLCGLLPSSLATGLSLPTTIFTMNAGLLADKRRSLAGFLSLIYHYFKLKVRILPFQGKWRDIPTSTLSLLGKQNGKLGHNTLAGKRAWDEQAGIMLCIGPITEAQFTDFQPGQSGYRALRELVHFYFGPDLECQLKFSVYLAVNGLRLSQTHPKHLGWSTWLGKACGIHQINTVLH